MEVAARLDEVRTRIARAAEACGRPPESVRLLAVSKTKPASAIREAYGAGQRDFGENYVQELEAKAAELADLPELRWHLIGHLQRNKAKHVVRVAAAVHSVDSARLAVELGHRAAAQPGDQRPESLGPRGRLAVLIEVNVGGEEQKAGCPPRSLGDVIEAVEAEPALWLCGLMTVPPHTDDPRGARPFFDQLVALRDEHGGAARLPELSMGMTHDLEVAIAAGATWVRVGTAIFGERR